MLLDFPTEILDGIFGYVPHSSLNKLMITCQRFHYIAARPLYRNPIVYGKIAARFFQCLARDTESAIRYGGFIRSLEFSDDEDLDAFRREVYPLVCLALLKMKNLADLELFTSADIVEEPRKLLHFMEKMRIVIRPDRVADGLRSRSTGSCGNHHYESVLPNLTTVTMTNIMFVSLARYRSGVSCVIVEDREHTLSEQVLSIRRNLCDVTSKNASLESLTIGVGHESITAVTKGILGISHCLPCLRFLTINGRRVNGLTITALFVEHPDIFPNLRQFTMALYSICPPQCLFPKQECIEKQRYLIERAATTRPSLQWLVFGGLLWSRDDNGTEWRHKIYHLGNDRVYRWGEDNDDVPWEGNCGDNPVFYSL